MLKKEPVHNRLFKEYKFRQDMLNEMRQQYLYREGQKYTFIPIINNYIIKYKDNSKNISTDSQIYSVSKNNSFLYNNFNEDNINYRNSNNKQNKSSFLYSISDNKSINYKKVINLNNSKNFKNKSGKKISRANKKYSSSSKKILYNPNLSNLNGKYNYTYNNININRSMKKEDTDYSLNRNFTPSIYSTKINKSQNSNKIINKFSENAFGIKKTPKIIDNINSYNFINDNLTSFNFESNLTDINKNMSKEKITAKREDKISNTISNMNNKSSEKFRNIDNTPLLCQRITKENNIFENNVTIGDDNVFDYYGINLSNINTNNDNYNVDNYISKNITNKSSAFTEEINNVNSEYLKKPQNYLISIKSGNISGQNSNATADGLKIQNLFSDSFQSGKFSPYNKIILNSKKKINERNEITHSEKLKKNIDKCNNSINQTIGLEETNQTNSYLSYRKNKTTINNCSNFEFIGNKKINKLEIASNEVNEYFIDDDKNNSNNENMNENNDVSFQSLSDSKAFELAGYYVGDYVDKKQIVDILKIKQKK